MEFTLRTPEGFIGRIYTYGYYDRCFFRGNGGTVNVLRISGPQGYPECGTQRVRELLLSLLRPNVQITFPKACLIFIFKKLTDCLKYLNLSSKSIASVACLSINRTQRNNDIFDKC